MKTSRPDLSAAAVLALLLTTAGLGLGCASVSGDSTRLMEETHSTAISASELRTRVRSLAGPFSGLIEETADRVLAQGPEPEVRERALSWKIHVLPEMQSALLQPDPLAALLDAWVLAIQLGDSLSDLRRSSTSLEREVGQEGIDLMLREIESLAELVSVDGDVERLRRPAEAWARQHPIRDTAAVRHPTSAALAPFVANAKVGLLQSMSLLTETRDDFATRADLYAAYLPKQARWQAELLLTRLLSGPELGAPLAEIEKLGGSFERITATVEAVPDLVTAERVALLEAVARERATVLEAISLEVDRVLGRVTEERLAVFEDHVAAEREAVFAAITAERVATLDAVRRERIETVAEVERVALEAVDRVALRLAQIVGGTLLVLALPFVWVVLRLSRRA